MNFDFRQQPIKIDVYKRQLPIGDLYMAGRSSVETFKKLEINTIGDLAGTDPDLIALHLKSHGRMLWEFANGRGAEVVQAEPEEAKGIGNSTTLKEDISDMKEVRPVFEELADSVGTVSYTHLSTSPPEVSISGRNRKSILS